jgi:hypothetical protein
LLAAGNHFPAVNPVIQVSSGLDSYASNNNNKTLAEIRSMTAPELAAYCNRCVDTKNLDTAWA